MLDQYSAFTGEDQGKSRAHANSALHRDVSTEERGEAAANRQAQAGAAISVNATLHLTKFFKDML